MPASGDQHKPNGALTTNPFDEIKPQISAYTAREIATLQDQLNRRLGPEYISTRAGPGGKKVAYLSAEKAINLANEVFGFNGWSSSIQNIQIDFVDENPQSGKVSIGLSVVVRVTLRDGTYHEDIGYGGIENCKGKIAAFEKAKKEGTTDALKRALRNFGNVLGNCIYDHDYIAKVSKVKAGPGRWDVNKLHRHPDFAPKEEGQNSEKNVTSLPTILIAPKLETEESFDVAEFDDNDFDDFGNPDEMLLPSDTNILKGQADRPPSLAMNTPSKPPQMRPQRGANSTTSYQNSHVPQTTGGGMPTPAQQTPRPLNTNEPHLPSAGFLPQHEASSVVAGGFYSARTAGSLNAQNVPGPDAAKFNPHAESRSIRKTPGVDHSKSLALNRHTLKPETLPQPKDMIDPKADPSRRVGMPAQGAASPMPRPMGAGMGTSAYRPPTRHGPQSPLIPNQTAAAAGTKRPPLEDLSNVQQQHQPTAITADGMDAKRQKLADNGSNAALASEKENANHVQ